MLIKRLSVLSIVLLNYYCYLFWLLIGQDYQFFWVWYSILGRVLGLSSSVSTLITTVKFIFGSHFCKRACQLRQDPKIKNVQRPHFWLVLLLLSTILEWLFSKKYFSKRAPLPRFKFLDQQRENLNFRNAHCVEKPSIC